MRRLPKKEQAKVLNNLSYGKRKAVEKKLYLIRKEKAVEKAVAKNHTQLEHFDKAHPDYKRLSKVHKHAHALLLSRKEKTRKKHERFLEQKSEELYNYFKKRNRKTGSSPDFFKGFSPIDRHEVVMLAEEKFELFYKHKKFFMKHDADEEPPGGVPTPEKRFFMEAQQEKRQGNTIAKQVEEKIAVPVRKSVADKNSIKKELLKDTAFLTELGNGTKKKGADKLNELTKQDWHRREGLSKKEFEALKRMGYVESSKNVYDFGNNLQAVVAYKHGGFSNESLHHFSKAYFTKEIIPETIIKEKIPGTNKEIDAVIPLPKNKRMAVEFQESHKLGTSKVLEKVKPILAQFDLLVIVCAETAKPNYAHVESDKVHILNNKEFQDFIRSLNLKGDPPTTKAQKSL